MFANELCQIMHCYQNVVNTITFFVLFQMPNVYCCITGCSSSTYHLKKWKSQLCTKHGCHQGRGSCTCDPPFVLIPFPGLANKDMRDMWIRFVNRKKTDHSWKKWEPNKDSRICSLHFASGGPDNANPYPTLNAGYTSLKTVTPRRKIVKHSVRRLSFTSNETMTITDPVILDTTTMECDDVDVTSATSSTESNKDTVLREHSYFYSCNCQPSCTCKGCETKDNRIMQLRQDIDRLTVNIADLELKKSSITMTDRLLTTDKKVSLYTGLPSQQVFHGLFDVIKGKVTKMQYWYGTKKTVIISTKVKRKFSISPKKRGPGRKIALIDEYLLTLMKLRLGSNMEDLADRFSIALSTASSIFNTWIRAMGCILKGLIFLPTRDIVLASMP